MFDGKLYKQIDGGTMENPLGPFLANIFLGHLEKTLFENPHNKNVHPQLYLQCIDDLYAVFQIFQSRCRQYFDQKF